MLKGTGRRFTTVGKSGFIASAATNRQQASAVSRNYVTTALADSGGGNGYSQNYSSTGKSPFVRLLDGFVPHDTKLRNMLFKDIYDHDPVAGAAVEIYATMPFSDFYLTGLKDRSALDVYHKSVERMRIKVVLPAISRDYLTYGRFIGSTIFDADENIFSDIMQQDSNSCSITPVPLAGMDPLIDLVIPDKLKAFMENRSDPRVQNVLKSIPKTIRDNYKKGVIPLDPASTLFIPRRTGSGDSIGTSYFERILPVHIMEKAMIRGSIDQVQRRQRAMMHITVAGDGDDFVPTQANLESVRDIFQSADQDPTGAIIVTHSGIQANEIRDAASFFRADELFEYFNSTKYKALGVSEAMITGEANFNSMDATLSLFVENLREYRALITRELFYEKIFPAIAYANGYTKDRYMVTGAVAGMGHNSGQYMYGDDDYSYAVCSDERHGFNFRDKIIDTSTLAMPIVSWQKHLRPQGDEAAINLLSAAEQHNVPVPLAMFASAAGLDINAIINSLDQEKALRKRIQKYTDSLAEYGIGQNQQQVEASLLKAASGSRLKPKNFLNRDYPDWLHPHNTDKMGRFKTTSAKKVKREYGKQLNVLKDVLQKRREDAKTKARALRKPR